MIFKKIEVFGFKSFADRLEVDFDSGVTCIVGPNGCGKSNVCDAVRWVLGEQSSKALRGNQMQDVIFKGTETRSGLGYCEVSLHFDNTQGTFPIDYTEVVLSRKLYRSGESEYFINRQTARLKDIAMLLHDSGIDRDGFSIISQGQVAEIINSKPESRRSIFEEAAGIAKFKVRKTEAEKKLEKTAFDIDRVNDVITEIDRTLAPLLRQAENAEKYIVMRDRLKMLEVNAYIAQYDNAAADKARISGELENINDGLKNRQAEINDMAQRANDSLDEISRLDTKNDEVREQILELSLDLERTSGEQKLVQEKLALLFHSDADIKTEIAVLQSQLDAETEKQRETSERHAHLVDDCAAFNKEYFAAAAALEDMNKITDKLNGLRLERAQLISKKRTIEGLIESGEGYKFSVRKVLEYKQNNPRARQIVGVVAKELEVAPEYETAIEMALGAAAQNIIAYDETAAEKMVDILKEQNWGRATFLPITSVKARTLTSDERCIIDEDYVIGVADEIVTYDKLIEPIVSSLLGRVVIVDELSNAIRLAKQSKYAFKIVTLEGDVIETRGSITGGSKGAQNNHLWHNNTLTEINEALYVLNMKIDELERYGDVKVAGEHMMGMKIRVTAIEAEIAGCNLALSNMNNTILLLEKSISDKQNAMHAVEKNITQTKGTDVDDADAMCRYEKTRRLRGLEDEINAIAQRKEELRALVIELDTQKAALGEQISELTQRYYKTEGQLARIDVGIEQMQQRVEEEYGLNYSGCYEFKADDFELEPAMREISDLKRKISALGPVNLNAIEESRESKARYDDYSTQVADLVSAKTDLEKVIAELGTEMESKFKDSFEKINHNFGVVFRELFGGGHARLELVPVDGKISWLESGIDIIAEPPGKKLSNLTLLSGGEKSLTAIAILFAILKLRPMPFCILDEIEAALDEANVARFAGYLQKFAQTTQFIVITHRKPTMELADNLYGVTMEEKGVSKLVSVKLATWETQYPDTEQAVHA